MADSNIQLNTDGTGKKLDTRTESTNNEHRQVFVLGDPATNAGVAPVDATKGLAVDLTATGSNSTGAPLNVALPAATVSTLTPPAAITNFANETGGNLAAIKADVDKIPSQGQALAAASTPVVLPVAQITTLTPPAAITGFATSTKQSDASQKTQVVDGSGNVIGSTTNALDINIKSGNPTTITATQSTAASLKTESVGTKTTNAAVPGTTSTDTLPGVANAAAPTYTETYAVKESMDLSGNQRTTLGTLLAGENLTTNRINNEPVYSFLNITTNATTTVKSGAGTLHGFTVNNNGFTTAGTITIYDNTAASGTLIGTFTIPLMPPGTVLLATTFIPPQYFDLSFSTGLTIVTATTAPAANITVMYR